jgi:hypothetical protein
MKTLQREILHDCMVADTRRLIAMCRRLASRRPPSMMRLKLVQIAELLELLVEEAGVECELDDLPETY